MKARLATAALLALATSGCGASSNILGKTAPKEHVESFESLLDLAGAAYDANDLDKALKYAKLAYSYDPDSERAAVLYGFVNLSLAGGDPFALAQAMVANEAKKKEGADAAGLALADGESGTSDQLSALKAVIGLSNEELALMGTRDDSDPALPVLIPRCVEDVRAAIEKMSFLNEAIRAVCPFIDPEARVEGDYRQVCDPTGKPRNQSHQAHFLWAFSHLTEALAFNVVLTYATVDPTGKKSNLELRVDKIKSADTSSPDNLSLFMGALKTIESTLDAILPEGGVCSPTAPTSQLRATLNDMLAVDAGFARIPGMPPKMKAGIAKAMAKIKAVEGGGFGAKAKALRGDFTKKMSKGLAEKIDTLGADPSLTPEKKDALCGSLATIGGGSGVTSAACDPAAAEAAPAP